MTNGRDRGNIFKLFLLIYLGFKAHGSKHQRKLYKHLFQDKGYDRRIRPVRNESNAVNVTLRLNIYQLAEIEEKAQHIKLSGWINQQWNDAHLSWDPENFGNISKINIQPSLIWKPDIVLYNNADEDLASYGGNMDTLKTRIIVDYQGNVYWFAPVLLRAQCGINVAQFPFDKQLCFFKFGSATYNMKEVDVFGKEVDVRNYSPHQEWKLLTHHTVRRAIEYVCCPGNLFPDVTFHFHFQRRSLFYVVNLIFPIVFITLLTVWIFNLPAQSGERMSVGVTLLLAVIVFMMMVTEMIPESSESIPLAGVFIIFCMVIMFLIIVSLGFVNGLYNRNSRDKPMGRWTRFILLERLSYFLRVRHDGHSDKDYRMTGSDNFGTCFLDSRENIKEVTCYADKNDTFSQIVMLMNLKRIEDRRTKTKENKEGREGENANMRNQLHAAESGEQRRSEKDLSRNATPEEEWQIVGKTLDRCFFVFFMLAFVVGCVWCFGATTYCY